MLKSLLLAIISLLLMIQTGLGQKVGIQPSILEFHLSPGTTESQVIRIANLSDKKISFEAYLADWLRDSTGAHEYFKPDTLPSSCAKWVYLSKNFIEVEPGKTEELLVRLQGPPELKAFKQMRWAMLFLQSASEKDSAARGGKQFNTKIKELLRVGVHIYQTPPSVTHAEAKGIALKEVPAEKNTYDFYMANTGETMLECKVHMELTNVETGKEYKLNRTEFPIFPSGKRKVRLVIPDTIPKGKYSALAVLDTGEESALEAVEKSIEVK